MKRILVLAAIAALCLWALHAFAYLPLSCNWSLDALRGRTRAAQEAASDYRIALAVRRNLADLRRIEQHCRTHVELYALEAENEALIGHKEGALQALRHALTIDQRPELFVYVGTFLAEMGRMDEAVEKYAIAIRFAHDNIEKIEIDELAQRAERRAQQLEAQQRR